MSIKTNTTSLQNILEVLSNKATESGGENLEEELATQDELITSL